jgi:acyl-CoA thioester hydrolase
MPGKIHADISITIPFHDVDMVGIVWHGHYLKYFELARTALMQKYNYDIDAMKESNYGWPVIESKCKYIKPLFYGMTVRVTATVKELANRLWIEYLIENVEKNERICRGHTIQVAVQMDTLEMCFETPKQVLDKFGIQGDEDL